MIGHCKTCMYFQPGTADAEGKIKSGACRRHTPHATLIPGREPGSVTALGYWPKTEPGQWCGEYEESPTGKPDAGKDA